MLKALLFAALVVAVAGFGSQKPDACDNRCGAGTRCDESTGKCEIASDNCGDRCGSGTRCDEDTGKCLEADNCIPSWEENQDLHIQRWCTMPTVNTAPKGGWGPVSPASAKRQLRIGNRVKYECEEWDMLRVGSCPTIQKLGGRDYAIQYGIGMSTLVVGEDSMMLIDAHNDAESFYNLMQENGFTKPISAIVMTHPHTDHNGGVAWWREKYPRLRVIGTVWLKDLIEKREWGLEVPTEVISERDGFFKFEGKKYRIVTPTGNAHSGADSYVVTPDRTLQTVDMIDPQRLNHNFWHLGQDFGGIVFHWRHLLGEAKANTFDYINPGHNNIAYKEDIELQIEFAKEIIDAYWHVTENVDGFGGPANNTNNRRLLDTDRDGKKTSLSVESGNFFDSQVIGMAKRVAQRMPRDLNIEITTKQCYMVYAYMRLFYSNIESTKGASPSFKPILPGKFAS